MQQQQQQQQQVIYRTDAEATISKFLRKHKTVKHSKHIIKYMILETLAWQSQAPYASDHNLHFPAYVITS